MTQRARRYFLDYGVAVLAVALAVFLRWLLDPLLHERVPHSIDYGAVAVALWVGGLGPALFATILGALVSDWLFVYPHGVFLGSVGDVAEVLTFLFSCSIIIAFGCAARAAQRRAEANAQRLELEVAEREKAEQALEVANRGKDEFLAMLSHELRTPLGALVNAAGVLELIGDQAPEASHARQVIQRQVKHMTKLIDDLLEVSRVIAGKIALHRKLLDLAESVAECLQTLKDANTIGQKFTVHAAPAWIEADPFRLQQILLNLIGNSLKYTPADGEIRISVSSGADEAIFRIEDTGMGIAPEILPHVFDLFVQSERGRNRPRGGLGIGLTVVRRLVELHDGSIEAESDGAGKGAVFIVRFPLSSSVIPDRIGSGASTVASALGVPDPHSEPALEPLASVPGESGEISGADAGEVHP